MLRKADNRSLATSGQSCERTKLQFSCKFFFIIMLAVSGTDTCTHYVQGLAIEDVNVVHCVILQTSSGLCRGEQSLERFRESPHFLVLTSQALHAPAMLVLVRAVAVLHPVHKEHVPAPRDGGDDRPSDQDHILSDADPALVRGGPFKKVLRVALLVNAQPSRFKRHALSCFSMTAA